MKSGILTYFGFILLLGFVSCNTLTRKEKDIYTITDKDTLINYHVTNHPGNRDNGVIFPSSKVILPEREIIQRDSIVERFYPDFIRFGLFESIGTMGGDGDYGIGTGLFGVFPDFEKLSDKYRGEKDYLFTGGIYRIGIIEHRLRWFRDSKNWTIGTHGIEFILPDSRGENSLISILPLYLRKRYYLREEIPYIAITPSLGIGYYPSMYANVSGSIEIGSIGGLNLRSYLGLAMGYNPSYAPQIKNNDYLNKDEGNSTVFPYFGIGISVLDFHNLVKETEIEWQYHEHSSWDIGLVQFAMMRSNANESIYGENQMFSGFQLKLANSFLAIPFKNNRFFVGTSLLNLMVLGKESWGMGILPFRAGYWFVVAEDELSAEPFFELSYFPSSMINIGAKVNLVISESINIGLIAGYVSGSTSINLPTDFGNDFGISKNFSNLYLGLNFGILDRIFYPHQLRYYK
jgi:hypothetical protein